MIFDLSKLKTPKNYGVKIGKSRVRIYQMIEAGQLESLKIDGVPFVIDNDKTEKPKEEPTTKK